MRLRRHAWVGGVLGLFVGLAPGRAQTAAEPVSPATEDALHAMSRMAAVIFAGQVTAIRRPQQAGGTVEIDFAVDDAIRGVSGGTYTLREWDGLWAAGNQPFRVGQRYLMLLHAPGRAGLSSPVGGSDGAIPILGAGERTAGVSEARTAGSLATTDGRVVDLRWVGTRVARAVSYVAGPPVRPASQPVAVRADARTVQVDIASPAPAVAELQGGAAYSTVIGMLRGWERAGDVAR
jgi:hypothetical protein